MTGREIEAAIETYLTNRGWRKEDKFKDGGYWRDPHGRNSLSFWAEALKCEANREAVETFVAKAKGSAA